jgi:hypothetical protein
MLNLDYEISKVVHLCELAPLDACMLPFSVKLHYNTQPKLIAAAIYQVYSVYNLLVLPPTTNTCLYMDVSSVLHIHTPSVSKYKMF